MGLETGVVETGIVQLKAATGEGAVKAVQLLQKSVLPNHIDHQPKPDGATTLATNTPVPTLILIAVLMSMTAETVVNVKTDPNLPAGGVLATPQLLTPGCAIVSLSAQPNAAPVISPLFVIPTPGKRSSSNVVMMTAPCVGVETIENSVVVEMIVNSAAVETIAKSAVEMIVNSVVVEKIANSVVVEMIANSVVVEMIANSVAVEMIARCDAAEMIVK